MAAPVAAPAKTASPPATPAKTAEAEKPKATEAPKPKPAAVKKAFQVVAGEYPSAPQLQEAMAKVKRAGFKPVTEKGIPRPTTMHRLLVGEYGDRGGAEASLQRVKAAGGQGFALREGDHFAVYAGSFAADSKAAQEKASLAAKGITATMRTATVPMPVTRLTVGRFATREEARRVADKLTKAGLKPTVTVR
jgi:cell division septation protein DedD